MTRAEQLFHENQHLKDQNSDLRKTLIEIRGLMRGQNNAVGAAIRAMCEVALQ